MFYSLYFKNTLMIGANNYVRHEDRYVMKYCLVAVISIWQPHRILNIYVKNGVFILLFTPFADIVLFFLNCKKRQCNKYYNGIPNSKMSDEKKTFTLF